MTYQNSAEKMVSEIMEGWETCTALLSKIWQETPIDEMALLFHSTDEVLSFLSQAVQLTDVTLFNYAYDTVTTRPIVGSYSVHYWFLTIPSGRFRIEVMCCTDGSPLHDSVRAHSGASPAAVHASFKCSDEEAYIRAHAVLRRAGWELWQRCDSSYGRFAYYGNEDENAGWFLKPRLNLRDHRETENDHA